jgi:SAM-dependent methyltransferase
VVPLRLHRRIPFVRRPFFQRDSAIGERDRLAVELESSLERISKYSDYVDRSGAVLQYRQAYFEVRGRVAPDPGLPTTRPWPKADDDLSYAEKLLGLLNIKGSKGAEIGPLNAPIVSKSQASNVLYVDHLDTDGIKAKYPSLAESILDIDRPIMNHSLEETLRNDAPLDYLVASQVFEHVANPIRWLREIAAVLCEGGLLSLSLPDRRVTFDLLREETRASDIVAAYAEDVDIPDVRGVYDHHSLASFVNMHWATPASVYPEQVIAGRGAVKPKLATDAPPLAFIERTKHGEYLDVHAWVFTPPSFLLAMAQLTGDGLLPYCLHQFYPTNSNAPDQGNSSFVVALRKAEGVTVADRRRSYLEPLGE